jgi:hypothetical protein
LLAVDGPSPSRLAHVAIRKGTVFVDVEDVSEAGLSAIAQALSDAASRSGLSEWTVGPFRLEAFDPPKVYGRISAATPLPGDTRLRIAHASAASTLRGSGYQVISTEDSSAYWQAVEGRRRR